MYLSKLELHGFKSFASPTVLHFDPGITAIVGPNGCGKSNIVDAVRWVIGEQRARILRSEKMENVIFSGTAKRRPLGMAEVQLTVENTRGVLPTEYSEVMLGRRLFRSGESDYLLNGTPCRLKDIVDLFMDTGMGAGAYSVIELKMIEEILSDNAEDRRHLFEEAAGITKYKRRRSQALRKLDATQADLTRLRDLTEEIDKRVRNLKRQAAKARRYQEYEARRKHLELALAQVEYDRLTEQQRQLEHEIHGLHDNLEAHTARMTKDEAELEALRKVLIDREQTLSESQQRLSAHLTSVRDLEAEQRLEQERLEHARREDERVMREQEEAEDLRFSLNQEVERLEIQCLELEPLHIEADHVLRESETSRHTARATLDERRQTLRELRQREQKTVDARGDLLRRLDRLSNRIDMLNHERERIESAADETANTLREHEQRVEETKQAIQDAYTIIETARQNLDLIRAEHEHRQSEIEQARDALQQLERRQEALKAEIHLLKSLIASFEDFSDSVQYLATSSAWEPSQTPLKTVADVLTCTPEHRRALEAALGDLGACILVRNDAEAARAAALLQAEQQGRATFLVQDRLPDAPTRIEGLGNATPLEDIVQISDPSLAALVPTLLHRCYLAETLEHARLLAAEADPEDRFVTPKGEWVDGRGIMRAGGTEPAASPFTSRLARREQLEATQKHLDALQAELDQKNEDLEALREALAALPLSAHQQALAEAEATLADADRIHTRALLERDATIRRQDEQASRRTAIEADIEASKGEMGPLREAVAEAETRLNTLHTERAEVETSYQTAEAEARAAQDRYAEANVAAVEARNRFENTKRDLERARQQIQRLAQQAEARRTRLVELHHTIETVQETTQQRQAELDSIRSQRTELEQEVAKAKTALLQAKVDIDTVESRLRKLRQAREQEMREENVRAVRQAEIQTRQENLVASVLDTFDLLLTEERIEIEDDFAEMKARAEVKDLRGKIGGLGSVNALALEEYEAEKERLDFMTAQQEDLEQAEATLLETIDEINTTAAARFDETYQAIRRSFQDLFVELFGQEATADLLLEDPDDPLESSINIIAKPRGKRPVSIAQLSSGEKTLTAIALLFAIYLVKPSPFCILDEVDAPLDDANIDRFMRLIRRFASDTQFILVTHNKRTMELADRLYGITMQEQGVSRLVSVKFEEALEYAG